MITIGGPTPAVEPLGLLVDCHRRIEAALAVLVGASQWGYGTISEEQRTALARALQFFREMAPKHTADEERSLFPRLREKGEPLPELDALENDHAAADNWHLEVDRLGRVWIENGTLEPADRATYDDLTARMAALYERHIAVEDNIVFPLARKRLSLEEQEQVRREMVSRRAITLIGASN